MQDLKVVLCQSRQYWEDKKANLEHFEALLKNVEGVDLIIFPEMFHTGFTMEVTGLAESMDHPMGIDWLKEQAARRQSCFYTSLITEKEGKFYNTGVFVRPNGELSYYNKRKLFTLAGEDQYYTPGKEAKIVELKGWRINLQICYDLRFPELSRNLVVEGRPNYDLCLYVANWPERRIAHWKALLPARAIENQSYVIGVNRMGQDGNELTYSGDSLAYNALGERLNDENAYQECIQEVELSYAHLEQVRAKLNFLKDVTLEVPLKRL
ncbi:MAG: nitrilase family protein [Bacteroidetes bacterium]|nr:MAG: nitrilase family protein [Bacteroidota bacterium]